MLLFVSIIIINAIGLDTFVAFKNLNDRAKVCCVFTIRVLEETCNSGLQLELREIYRLAFMFGQRNENERAVRTAFVPEDAVTGYIYVGKLFLMMILSPVAEQVTVGAVVAVVSVADLADFLGGTPRRLAE